MLDIQALTGYQLHIVDSGWYCLGWYEHLASGWCLIEISVFYQGQH
jgi:hypothetical protein